MFKKSFKLALGILASVLASLTFIGFTSYVLASGGVEVQPWAFFGSYVKPPNEALDVAVGGDSSTDATFYVDVDGVVYINGDLGSSANRVDNAYFANLNYSGLLVGDDFQSPFNLGDATGVATTTIQTETDGDFTIDTNSTDDVLVLLASGLSSFGTSTPYSQLTVWGSGNLLELVADTGSTTVMSVNNSGVISSATWQGNTVEVTYGGTGSTTLTGILKGNTTSAIQSAVADTDYQVPLTFGDNLTRTLNDIDVDDPFTITDLISTISTSTTRCYADGTCASTANPLSDDVIFYFHNEGGDWGYEIMLDTGTHGETEDSDSCAATTGYCSLGGYITATSTINTVTWPGGTYHFDFYADVSAAAGTSYIVADVYSVDITGTETWQFQATSSELTIDVANYSEFASSQAEITTSDPSDKMLVKLRGWTDSASAKTITYYYEGEAHYSHFHTTFSNVIELGNYTQDNIAETITELWIFGNATTTQATFTDIWVDGVFYDSNGSTGALGEILSSTLTGNDWIATSTLNIAMANLTGFLDLTSQVTGTLPEANGGTGDTDLDDILGTANEITVTDGANTIIGGNATLSLPSLVVLTNATTSQLTVDILYDSNGSQGGNGEILSSTVTGTDWIAAVAGAVTSIATTYPISGGTITETGTISLSDMATTTLTGTAPIVFSQAIEVIGGTASVITCNAADTDTTGCISNTDWNTFNNKWDLASSTIGVAYGGTGSTTLTGLIKGNGTGVVLSAVADTDYQSADADLIAISALSGTGFLVRTGAGTYSERTIATSTDKIVILNSDGVLGNPTFGIRAASLDLTTDVTGVLPLANGGSAKNLTASNGGIIYSDADSMEVLSGTATAGQILRSGSSAAPSWSTATFASTYADQDLLYSNGANTVAGLTKGSNNDVLTVNGSGNLEWASDLTLNSIQVATIYVTDTVDQGDLNVSPGNILTGQSATTTIRGDSGNSNFSGYITTDSITIASTFPLATTTLLTVDVVFDSNGSPGGNGEILSSTVTGTDWVAAGAGTVTSVGFATPIGLSVSGTNPITSSGTFTLAYDILNTFIPFGGASNEMATSSVLSFVSGSGTLNTTALTATGLGTFGNASTTALSTYYASSTEAHFGTGYFPNLIDPAGTFVAVDGVTGELIATTTPASGGGGADTALSNIVANEVVMVATLELSAANIISMNGTPIEIIANPGSGKTIAVDQVVCSYTYGGTQFTGGGAVHIQEETSATNFISPLSQAEMQAAASIIKFREMNDNRSVLANKKIYITNDTAAFADGNGTMKVFIRYRIITL